METFSSRWNTISKELRILLEVVKSPVEILCTIYKKKSDNNKGLLEIKNIIINTIDLLKFSKDKLEKIDQKENKNRNKI